MTKGISISVLGRGSLKKTLEKKINAASQISAVLEKGALRVLRDAKILVHVDTGVLRSSLHYVKIDDLTFKVADGVIYGKFHNYGTKYQEGTFFMEKAMKQNKKPIINDLKSLFK